MDASKRCLPLLAPDPDIPHVASPTLARSVPQGGCSERAAAMTRRRPLIRPTGALAYVGAGQRDTDSENKGGGNRRLPGRAPHEALVELMKEPRIHAYKAKDGWRWHLRAANGRDPRRQRRGLQQPARLPRAIDTPSPPSSTATRR